MEYRWALARWHNGRLQVRRGLPPGVLALLCRVGLHFMIRNPWVDGYACVCRRQFLWNDQLWRA